MNDAEFDVFIDWRTDWPPEKFGRPKWNPLNCCMHIHTPHRPPPKTPKETLERAEWRAEASWPCTCALCLRDCYTLLKARRTVERCIADPGFNSPTDEELGIWPDGRIKLWL